MFCPIIKSLSSQVKGERVLFIHETLGKDYTEVDTKVVNENGNQIPVVYMLKRRDDDWKVYDVVVENVSIDNNYRFQFDRVISRTSYKELVQQMKQKTDTS